MRSHQAFRGLGSIGFRDFALEYLWQGFGFRTQFEVSCSALKHELTELCVASSIVGSSLSCLEFVVKTGVAVRNESAWAYSGRPR